MIFRCFPDHPQRVMVCHGPEDATPAAAIRDALVGAGLHCHTSRDGAGAGRAGLEATLEAIGEAGVVLLVFSHHTNHSREILIQLDHAAEDGIPVIVAPVEDAEPSPAMRYFTGVGRWMDPLTPPIEDHLEAIVENVRDLLPRHAR